MTVLRFLGLAAALFLTQLLSCDPQKKCESDAVCSRAEICVEGLCVVGCRTSRDCAQGELCKDGKCTQERCEKGDKQSCYEGKQGTLKVGLCRSGVRFCNLSGRWDLCSGQLLAQPEVCDREDNDCNGKVDDGINCECEPGKKRFCYAGPPGSGGKGACKAGSQVCLEDRRWDRCKEQILPTPEKCNGIDDDCNGTIDDGSSCHGQEPQPEPRVPDEPVTVEPGVADRAGEPGPEPSPKESRPEPQADASPEPSPEPRPEPTPKELRPEPLPEPQPPDEPVALEKLPEVTTERSGSAGNTLFAIRAGGVDDDQVKAIQVAKTGEIYIAGRVGPAATFGAISKGSASKVAAIFVAKLDATGKFLWVEVASSAQFCEAVGLVIGANGELFVMGHFTGTTTFGTLPALRKKQGSLSTFVAKIDATGKWKWVSEASSKYSCRAYSIAADANGAALLTGSFYVNATFDTHVLNDTGTTDNDDIFVAKIDATGKWLWAKSAGSTKGDVGRGVAVDSKGDVYITGEIKEKATFGGTSLTLKGPAGPTNSDAFVAKLKGKDGAFLWAKAGGSASGDFGQSIAVTPQGQSFVAGVYSAGMSFAGQAFPSPPQGRGFFVLSIDTAGKLLRSSTGSARFVTPLAIAERNGILAIAGNFQATLQLGTQLFQNPGKNYGIFVASLDSTGTWRWARVASSSTTDFGWAVDFGPKGEIYAAGGFGTTSATFGQTTLTSKGSYDIFVWKLSN